jgi:hypothetical protein
MNEIDALKKIDEILSNVTDKEALKRIILWMSDKYSKDLLKRDEILIDNTPKRSSKTKPTKGKTAKSSTKAKSTFSVVKNLNLKPADQDSFLDFAGNKKPTSHKQKIVVCIYYLKNLIRIEEARLDHVYTCYKVAKWRLPTNLRNMMAQAATEGWLDIKNSENIEMTTLGDNLVEHDLPKPNEKS